MPKDGHLLLVECVIPPGNDPSFGKPLDLAMLVIPGGEERTEDEYRDLYKTTGFRLTSPTGSQSHRNRIDRKHVDFLLCHSEMMKPLVGLELDDQSHGRPDR